jgi:hypothetical protein
VASGTGTATVAFGTGAGTDRATVTVSGQTGLVAADHVEAWIMRDSTSDHNADEHEVFAREARVVCEVTGSGTFVIAVVCNTTWTGDFKVRWVWASA